jgi:hypothetical protein
MKKKTPDQRDWHERRIEEARKKPVAPEPSKEGAKGRPVKGGAPETAASRETFPKRARKPGDEGLANEARPGLGTRADEVDPGSIPSEPPKEAQSESKPQATPHAYEEPNPAPREQAPDSMAHEQERSTGVSGHTGNS